MSIVRMAVKALPLLQLTLSGVWMTGVSIGLIPGPFPDEMLFVNGDPTAVNKFTWAAKFIGDILSVDLEGNSVALIFGVCQLAAAISWWSGLIEALSTFCVVIMYGAILYSHIVLGDSLPVVIVLMLLAAAKLVLGAEPAAKKGKRGGKKL